MTSKVLTISAALVLLGGAPAAAQGNGSQGNGWLGTTAAYANDYRDVQPTTTGIATV